MSARKKKYTLSAEELSYKLKLKHLEVAERIRTAYPHVGKLLKDKGLQIEKIRQHSAKLLGAGAITGALLLAPGELKLLPSPQEIIEKLNIKNENTDAEKLRKLLADTLNATLPKRPRPLMRDEEKFLEGVFTNTIGIPVRASLEGEHLNTTYGLIGAEQHLRRFPGDNLALHGEEQIRIAGIAPGLSAWGYFALSKEAMTTSLEQTEKWYAVVQTLYLPDWNKRQPYLRDWYKYRKVFIINTQNGNAVIAAVADSGPAAWTGKHFGGSPEVMEFLGGTKYKKGPVIVFFVDDPENKIPLGPIKY